MLNEFLISNREAVIMHCQQKTARRSHASRPLREGAHGVPLFLQQLIDILTAEQLTPLRDVSDPPPAPAGTDIGHGAALHGAELLRLGYTVDQVVHGYGDVCQAVTELAVEQQAGISADEFRSLNRCLDNAIAEAVTSFGSAGQALIDQRANDLHERLNVFAEEQRRLICAAIEAFSAIQTGNVGVGGSTGASLMDSLEKLRYFSDQSLPEIRLSSAAITLKAS